MEEKKELDKGKHRSYIVWAAGGSCSSFWAETFSKVPCHSRNRGSTTNPLLHFWNFKHLPCWSKAGCTTDYRNARHFNCTFPIQCDQCYLFKIWRYKIKFFDKVPKRLCISKSYYRLSHANNLCQTNIHACIYNKIFWWVRTDLASCLIKFIKIFSCSDIRWIWLIYKLHS